MKRSEQYIDEIITKIKRGVDPELIASLEGHIVDAVISGYRKGIEHQEGVDYPWTRTADRLPPVDIDVWVVLNGRVDTDGWCYTESDDGEGWHFEDGDGCLEFMEHGVPPTHWMVPIEIPLPKELTGVN